MIPRGQGAAEANVIRRRLEALKSKFHVEDGWRWCTPKPGADRMDVTLALVTACRGC